MKTSIKRGLILVFFLFFLAVALNTETFDVAEKKITGNSINQASTETDIAPNRTESASWDKISLEILNPQSYPVVGGNWTVMFNTTGVANLTIETVDGTTWAPEDNATQETDIEFLELVCGNDSVDYKWKNGSVFVPVTRHLTRPRMSSRQASIILSSRSAT